MHRVVGVIRMDRYYFGDELVDIAQKHTLVRAAKGQGNATGSRAPRTADAVDIGLRLVGNVIIDNMGQAININAARRDICGHQGPGLAGLKVGQRLLPGVL